MNRQPDSKKKSTEETSELKERIRELEKSEAERGHVQQALRESEERWQFALEGAGDGVWDWNAQTNEVFFSKQWKAMLGFTEDEIGGTFDEWDRRVHPDDREYAHAEINRHFEGKSPVYINEHRIKCKDGTYKWILARGKIISRTHEGKPLRVIGTHTDMTERKLVEEALRESEERQNAILSNVGAYIFLKDTEYRYTYINSKVCGLFGLTADEIIGKSDKDFFPADAAQAILKSDRRVIEQGEAIAQEETMAALSDNAERTYWVVKLPLRDSGGVISGLCGISTDISEHKRMEDVLRSSEARYRALVETTGDWIWEIDRNGVYTYASPKIKDVLGYTVDEIIGKTPFDLMPPEEAKRVAVEFQKIAVSFSPFSGLENANVHKDGRLVVIETSGTPLFDKEGGYSGYTGFDRDVTSRKQAEEALRKAEERYRSIFENAPYGICQVTPEGRYLSANPAMVRMFGYDSAEELMETVSDAGHQPLVNPADGETLTSLLSEHGKVEKFETRIFRKDGKPIWVSLGIRVARDADGKILYYEATNEDITERKQAEEALQESREALWSLINATMESLLLVDPEGKILIANETVAQRLGKSVGEVIGTCQYDYFPQETADFRKAQYAAVLRTGKPVRFEDSRIGRLFESCAYPVFDDQGAVSKIAIFATDITERRKGEEEKTKLEAQLLQSQKIEAIGTLAGGIAHDFNNILTALIGYGTLLQMGLGKDNPLSVHVDHILSSSEKAAQLTQSLLTFSRKQPVALKPLNLNDTIRGTERLLGRLLTEDIQLQTDLTPDDTTVMGDATQIDQILFNLATNARDAMPLGGTLTIETGRVEMDSNFIRDHGYGKTGTYVLISVSDTGTGMDEETKRHIFDPFFTTKEVGRGTGLGLSTIYGVVVQHNGYINVSSEPGRGTIFHIYFPAVTAAVENEEPASVEMSQGHETILVAEDNEGVRSLVKTILSKYGYTIIEAVDGEDAVRQFNAHEDIDLLIIDSVMPKKNGRQVYDEIYRKNRHIRVLFMSGYTRDIVLDKGIEEKSFHFISKPLSPNGLLRKVREVLDSTLSLH